MTRGIQYDARNYEIVSRFNLVARISEPRFISTISRHVDTAMYLAYGVQRHALAAAEQGTK